MSQPIPMSCVPPDATERTVSPFRREGSGEWLREAECVVDGKVIAIREYDGNDILIRERPMNDKGRNHGLVLEWHENGQMQLAEPYVDGVIHGTARQWHHDGSFLGTYTLDHGTGFDIWRDKREDGEVVITEIHSLHHGELHGFQWWFEYDQTLCWERHFRENQLHGIEREWNDHGRLRRDTPRYWIKDEKVNKRRYLRAARGDDTLPPFRPEDQQRDRVFPPELLRLLDRDG